MNLVPLAVNVVKLTAVCMRCYGEAAFTQRLGSETEVILKIDLVSIESQILINKLKGGTDWRDGEIHGCLPRMLS